MSDAYGYDINSLKANTKKDKLKKDNIDKINKLKSLLTNEPNNNAQATPNSP